MSMSLDQWAADVNGRVIGDGQCVALVEDYAARVCGTGPISTDGTVHPGYAVEMWHNGPSAGYSQHSASEPAMPGWIAVYGWGFEYTPLSHVAVVLNDGGIDTMNMSQNPGPAHTMAEPKLGLLGYLAPGGASNPGNVQTVASISTAGNILDAAGTLTTIGGWISNPNNWKRIGLATVGVIAVLIVLVKLFNLESTVKGIMP